MIEAVVFDMDGTLVNSEPENLRILKEFMAEQGIAVSEEFLISLVGTSYEMTCSMCLAHMPKDWTLERFQKAYEAYDRLHPYNYGAILHPHVRETLAWLKEHGYRTAIASSSPLRLIEKMVAECDLKDLVDEIVSGEMFEESKPHPEIYLHTAQQLKVEPAACLAVEDSGYGIEAALRAGMQVLAYRDRQYGMDQSGADAIIDDLREIKEYV